MVIEFRAWDFDGGWTIGRWIEDRALDRRIQFVGRAVFTPAGEGVLSYHEDGRMHGPGLDPIRAERRHTWRFDEGRTIHVDFEDGRPFYDFDPLAARPRATHDCPPDLYAIALDFGAWPEWKTVWTVSGPEKDMTITSIYRREAGVPN